jgi:hypothetical protein
MNQDSVNAIKHTVHVLLVILWLLSAPAMLHAATPVALSEGEKTLVENGEIILREISTIGKEGHTFEAIGVINAPKKTIMRVLTDYEKYPEFMPNVSRIDIVEQRTNEAVLNYTLSLPLGKIKKYRLGISATDEDKNVSKLQWQLQKWPGLEISETIKDTTGYWLIREETPKRCLVLYHVYTDPGPVPFGLGWIVDALSKNSVPEAFLQTRLRTEKITLQAHDR